jgi:transcriptional regulator with XRE-family HTH domain
MNKIESELVHRFADNLSRLRKARGLSQEELAHRAGIDRTFVSGCERHVRNPTLTTVEKIAAGLEVDPENPFIFFPLSHEQPRVSGPKSLWFSRTLLWIA